MLNSIHIKIKKAELLSVVIRKINLGKNMEISLQVTQILLADMVALNVEEIISQLMMKLLNESISLITIVMI